MWVDTKLEVPPTGQVCAVARNGEVRALVFWREDRWEDLSTHLTYDKEAVEYWFALPSLP